MIAILLFLGFLLIYFNKDQLYNDLKKINELGTQNEIVNKLNKVNVERIQKIENYNNMSLRSLRNRKRGCRSC